MLLSEEIMPAKTAAYKRKTIFPNAEVVKESWTQVPRGDSLALQ